jgi:hypothetical protein
LLLDGSSSSILVAPGANIAPAPAASGSFRKSRRAGFIHNSLLLLGFQRTRLAASVRPPAGLRVRMRWRASSPPPTQLSLLRRLFTMLHNVGNGGKSSSERCWNARLSIALFRSAPSFDTDRKAGDSPTRYLRSRTRRLRNAQSHKGTQFIQVCALGRRLSQTDKPDPKDRRKAVGMYTGMVPCAKMESADWIRGTRQGRA